MSIKLVKNDTRPVLQFTCKDDAGVIIDLTNATAVNFIFKKSGATIVKFKRECSITYPLLGICNYSWQSGDLNESGYFEGEVEITFNDGTKQTVADKLGFDVRADLDNL